MAQYWIAALKLKEGESRDEQFRTIMPHLKYECDDGELCKFDVPQNLTFRSFDSLIKLVDDLQKSDPQVEGTLRRVEKQLREFMENPDFAVVSRGKTYPWKKYLEEFQWDDAKFPKNRTISENLSLMMQTVGKLDDEVRTKLAALGETKSGLSAMVKEGSYGVADLITVITPNKVSADDFVETEHLTTVVVVCPKGQDEELLEFYETVDNFVVPDTAKLLSGVEPDKEGNTLYRVVLFKKAVPAFKAAVSKEGSSKRFIVRDFTYSAFAFNEYSGKKASMEQSLEKQESMCKMVCKAAFADMFLAWIHIKAMRTFVESVLRYGVGADGEPAFGAMLLKVPPAAGQQKSLRNFLAEATTGSSEDATGADEGEEYFPYVSLSLTPLSGE